MTDEASRDLGDFPVGAGTAEVAAFRAALGDAATGPELPLTYPMRWLAGAEVRAALMALVPEADRLPVHESQSFAYARVLRVGEGYRLRLAARRAAAPERLIVDAVVAGADGAECARIETVLRLVSTAAGAP